MKQIAAVIGVIVLLVVCVFVDAKLFTDAPGATRVLQSQGYTDIKITGHAWFQCDEKDKFETAFTAKSPAGVQVSGAVCPGWFKGNTVRFQ